MADKKQTNWLWYGIVGLFAGGLAYWGYTYFIKDKVMPAPPVTDKKNAAGATAVQPSEQSWYCANHPNAPGCDKVGKGKMVAPPIGAAYQSWNCLHHPDAPGCDKVKTGALVVNRATNWPG